MQPCHSCAVHPTIYTASSMQLRSGHDCPPQLGKACLPWTTTPLAPLLRSHQTSKELKNEMHVLLDKHWHAQSVRSGR